jgi:hypothetical protein
VNRDARNRASRATVARFRARGGENFREGPRPEKPPTAAVAHFVSSRLRRFARADALERRLTFSFLFSPFSFRRAQIEEERRELDKALRSSVAREKLDGLKRLIGMMSTGRDVSQFFAAVVMNLAQDSFEVKVLVYIYLVRTAEQKADEALLSINSFQKDLAHPNPRVRALALRVMSSIRVDVIVPVVILAVRKCAVDVSPYVRKAAAHAIPKVYRLDKSRQHELVEIIETMLRDSTPFVLSSAVAAFQEVCPDRVDLIHRHFRKICRMLVDMDEWGQILMANLLTRYARAQFVRPDAYDRELTVDAVARGNQDGGERALALALPNESGGAFEKQSSNPLGNTAGFYSDSDSDSDSDASGASDESGSNADRSKKAPKKASAAAAAGGAGGSGESYLDDDHRLLLRCSRPLLQSQNAGVVMAVGAMHFYLAPVADLPKTLRALVFAMRCKPESQHVMLKNICTMVAVQPSLFQTHFNSFFVHPADPNDVRALKLEILTHVCTAENAPVLLRELQAYLRSGNDHFVALTIRAIGRCAAIMPQIASVCVRSLLELSLHPSEKVAGEAVVVIRALVQRDPKEHLHVVMRLIRRMEALRSPAARAAVAWLAGGELYVFGAGRREGRAGGGDHETREGTRSRTRRSRRSRRLEGRRRLATATWRRGGRRARRRFRVGVGAGSVRRSRRFERPRAHHGARHRGGRARRAEAREGRRGGRRGRHRAHLVGDPPGDRRGSRNLRRRGGGRLRGRAGCGERKEVWQGEETRQARRAQSRGAFGEEGEGSFGARAASRLFRALVRGAQALAARLRVRDGHRQAATLKHRVQAVRQGPVASGAGVKAPL